MFDFEKHISLQKQLFFFICATIKTGVDYFEICFYTHS